jgi:hypothetical protein
MEAPRISSAERRRSGLNRAGPPSTIQTGTRRIMTSGLHPQTPKTDSSLSGAESSTSTPPAENGPGWSRSLSDGDLSEHLKAFQDMKDRLRAAKDICNHEVIFILEALHVQAERKMKPILSSSIEGSNEIISSVAVGEICESADSSSSPQRKSITNSSSRRSNERFTLARKSLTSSMTALPVSRTSLSDGSSGSYSDLPQYRGRSNSPQPKTSISKRKDSSAALMEDHHEMSASYTPPRRSSSRMREWMHNQSTPLLQSFVGSQDHENKTTVPLELVQWAQELLDLDLGALIAPGTEMSVIKTIFLSSS